MVSESGESVRRALIILDGLGDRPHPDTGGVSPVEAARTPNLDRLLNLGRSGRVMILGAGIAPESDAGVLALLGYDPVADSPGRGALEAMGVGIPLAPGDVALRLNFATTDGEEIVLDSRVGRSLSTGEARQLSENLTRAHLLAAEGIEAEVRPTVGHRGVLWLHPTDGSRLSSGISNADPFYEKIGGMGKAIRPEVPRVPAVRPTDSTPEAKRTAEAVEGFLERAKPILAGATVNARRAMSGKPVANGLLLRNAGTAPAVPLRSLPDRLGVSGAAVTEMPVERGIAHLVGLEDRFVGPMGPDRVAGYHDRARVTRETMAAHGFTYVHLKGPDEPGHDRKAGEKREVVEALDEAFFGPFLDGLDLSAVRLAITADHATPCVLGMHSDDPVPLILAGGGVAAESVGPPSTTRKFSEREAARGSLGQVYARDVLDLLFPHESVAAP